MRFAYILMTFALAGSAFADTLVLRNGQVVNGTYLGGNPREIKMQVDNQIQTFDLSQVVTLNFTSSQSAPQRQSYSQPPQQQAPPAPAPPPQTTATVGVELPAGTAITVRLIDSIDSRQNKVGQTFNASLDEPVLINGNTAIPRGSDAIVKLVDDKESGKLAGKTVLTLDLVSVRVNGQMVDINTQTFSQASGSRGARTAKLAGGGAALGAIIGGIAGGGRGAAIGAGAGAGAGAGTEILTKGQQVRIPSETRLTFTVDTPIRI
jgi:hypothetical protein